MSLCLHKSTVLTRDTLREGCVIEYCRNAIGFPWYDKNKGPICSSLTRNHSIR